MNIIDEQGLLTKGQKDLLLNSASLPFDFGGYQSLDDILCNLKVNVVIEPGVRKLSLAKELDKAISYWNGVANNNRSTEGDKARFKQAIDMLDRIEEEKKLLHNTPLRGSYDSDNNVIRLYPEEMKSEYKGDRLDELLVSILAHETMHAYFNRTGHENYPYVLMVEEPLAEFGMLIYLEETHSTYYDWAYQDVMAKKTCYRYGASLMDEYKQGNDFLLDYLVNYKVELNHGSMITTSVADGEVVLPCDVQVGQSVIRPSWKNIIKKYPPQIFYDEDTQTLGLDGEWCGSIKGIYSGEIGGLFHPAFPSSYGVKLYFEKPIKHIYIGEHFELPENKDDAVSYKSALIETFSNLFADADIIVSPDNGSFKAIKGELFDKLEDTKIPFLSE